jgi:ATP-dependent Clp protease ATP-binding subunit ClpC
MTANSSAGVHDREPQYRERCIVSVLSTDGLSPEAQRALDLAAVIARNNGHLVVTADHLALALLKQSDSLAARLLRHYFGVDLFELRARIERALRSLRPAPVDGLRYRSLNDECIVAPDVQQIIERAKQLAAQQAKPVAGTDHLLTALLEQESAGASELRRAGLLSGRVAAASVEIPLPPGLQGRGPAVYDLVQAVQRGSVPRTVERAGLIRSLATLLAQPRASVVLLGEPGVGRRALIIALAQLLAREPLPGVPRELWAIRPEALLDNPEMVIRQAIERAQGGLVALHDLHQFFGASSLSGFGEAGVALKQALLGGTVRIIGTTTAQLHARYLEPDPVLHDCLHPLPVPPPDESETRAILEVLAPQLARDFQVQIDPAAVQAAVRLSRQYLTQVQPAAAVSLLQRACALVRLSQSAAFRQDGTGPDTIVDAVDVAQALHEQTGIPMGQIAGHERDRLARMEEILHQRVVGQDAAISALARAVRRARAGLKDPRRPIGSFLFLGPTGVGKTESALALAEFLFGTEDAVIALNMSEYMERHNVARLIGAPPGYVGYEEGGQLTEKVRQRPYAVVLIDEVEKAHPDVYDLFLQVLDRGELQDGRGRVVSFRNTVIIMTSNLGTRALTYPDELAPGEDPKAKVLEAVRAHFRPEFLNRLDAIIVFDPLDPPALRKILELMLRKVQKQLAEQQISVAFSEAAVEWLLAQHHEPEYGARPLIRIVQSHVKDAISERLINGELQPGDTVQVTVRAGALFFRTRRAGTS